MSLDLTLKLIVDATTRLLSPLAKAVGLLDENELDTASKAKQLLGTDFKSVALYFSDADGEFALDELTLLLQIEVIFNDEMGADVVKLLDDAGKRQEVERVYRELLEDNRGFFTLGKMGLSIKWLEFYDSINSTSIPIH